MKREREKKLTKRKTYFNASSQKDTNVVTYGGEKGYRDLNSVV